MRTRSILLFVLFGLLSQGVFAQKSKVGQKANATNGTALLYRITGNGIKKPSYLFGTMHIVCPDDVPFAEKIASYIDRTEQMMLEIDLSKAETMQQAVSASMMKDGKTLSDLLSAEEFAELDRLYMEYVGVSVNVLKTMNPTLVGSYLFSSPKIVGCAKPLRFDSDLADVAALKKMKVVGLETVADQMGAIESAPIEDQLKSLREILTNLDKQKQVFARLKAGYRAQDSDTLYSVITDVTAASSPTDTAMMANLLDVRNKKWIPIIESNIKSKPTFIAFGAGHLGGKNGVVALLRARGYVVTPIRL